VPELPDLEVYVEALERHVGRRLLQRIIVVKPFVLRSVEPGVERFAGHGLKRVSRLGKRLVLAFDSELFAVMHLMIAGRLKWRSSGDERAPRGTLVRFEFSTGTLYLTEAGSARRASLFLLEGEEGLAGHDPGGIEVLTSDLRSFGEALRRGNHTLKRALTDQRILAGIGNAYSDEILHRARMSPFKQTANLSDKEVEVLHWAARVVLREWIERLQEACGGAFPEQVTAFHDDMAVHGRFHQPCPVCGAPVQRIVYAHNEANYCAACQTGGKLLADRALSRLLKKDWPKRVEDLEAAD
jgi:formamidopyrimidine-DNA glycosylase